MRELFLASQMGWIDFVWPMIGAASLTLGLVFLLAWGRQPRRYGYAMFFVTALSVAAFSIFELRMMRATTPEEYAITLRWAHIPLFTLVVSVVGFVRLHFLAGRAWLGYLGCGLRAVSLVLNFHSDVNLNFDQVTAMVPVPVWGGERIYLPVGIPNPAAIVAQLGNLLVIGFLADAAIALSRRGGAGTRRHAAVVGTLLSSLLATAVFAALLNLGLVRLPTVLSVAFLAVVAAVAYELGWDVMRSVRSSLDGKGHDFQQDFRIVLPDGHVSPRKRVPWGWAASFSRAARTDASCRWKWA